MLNIVPTNEVLDQEYRELWIATKGLKEDDPGFDEMFNRICEIEQIRDPGYTKEELRALRMKT